MSGVLAIVPARGGSQQVANKNIAAVLGRPALAYTLDHIRAATTIDFTVVSTEDSRVAAVARELGATVIDRPAELSRPDSRLDHVLRHALVATSPTISDPSIVVMLYGAVPIRPQGFIDRCVRLLQDTGADSVRSLAPAQDRHPLWSVKLDHESRIDEYLGPLTIYRRQELPPVFFYTGACVAIRVQSLLRGSEGSSGNFDYLGRDQRGAVHEPHECVEIHEPIDIEWAEFLLSRRRENR